MITVIRYHNLGRFQECNYKIHIRFLSKIQVLFKEVSLTWRLIVVLAFKGGVHLVVVLRVLAYLMIVMTLWLRRRCYSFFFPRSNNYTGKPKTSKCNAKSWSINRHISLQMYSAIIGHLKPWLKLNDSYEHTHTYSISEQHCNLYYSSVWNSWCGSVWMVRTMVVESPHCARSAGRR